MCCLPMRKNEENSRWRSHLQSENDLVMKSTFGQGARQSTGEASQQRKSFVEGKMDFQV